ncbi:MAG: phosphomannomutase/phosphoglucomutase [Chloroflexi bacterium]|nr:phosphomannomutase/phosphoglucomutase [Chloroflexota bacterium]
MGVVESSRAIPSDQVSSVINPHIFREYDIRGIADRDLTDDLIVKIGRAFGTFLQREGAGRTLAVGRDNRLSSLRIQRALMEGLLSAGCDVLDVGEVATPIVYFSIWRYQRAGGIVVTGSHNPPQFNGLKMALGLSTIFGPAIQQIRRIVESDDFTTGRGSYEAVDPVPTYLAYVAERIHLARPMKVAVDSGNGMTGPLAPRLLRDLGCEVVELYTNLDGTFPNHIADPTVVSSMQDLAAAVRREGCAVGLGFDGDGDRIGAVDEQGNIVWGDKLLILFSRDLLQRRPGAKVIFDVKSSQAVVEDVQAHGGQPIMWRVGHSHIKNAMKTERALIGAEMSGHMYFAEDYLGFDDAVYAGVKLVELLSKHGAPLSALVETIPPYVATPEIRVACPDEVKFKVVEEVREHFRARYPIIDLDGVRVLFPEGWALLRASNTEPVLVLRYEARTEAGMKEIEERLQAKLREVLATVQH